MSSERLLPDSNGEAGTSLAPNGAVRRKWRGLYDTLIAKAPTNGARVAESLDYEPIQNEMYFNRLKARKGIRHYYGYASFGHLSLRAQNYFVVSDDVVCTGDGY